MLAVTEPPESWARASPLLDIEDVEFVWFRERGAGVQRISEIFEFQLVRHQVNFPS